MKIAYTTEPREDTGLYNGKLGIWLFLASEVMLFGALFSSYVLLRMGAWEGTWPHGLLNIPIGAFNTLVLIASSVTVALSWTELKLGNFQRYRRLQLMTLGCAALFLGVKGWEYSQKFAHYEVWLETPLSAQQYPQLAGHVNQSDEGATSIIGHIEGAGNFWTLASLKAQGIDSIELVPDAYHYRLSARQQAQLKKAQHSDPAANSASANANQAVEIDLSNIKRLSALTPGHGTFFATYFTLTGLHALHVLGGALTFAFILWPGSRMWHTDPQRYINSVEVTGLFWHFVDLVWIFLFPVIYLL